MIGARTIRCLILAGIVVATASAADSPWSSWQRINPLPSGASIRSIAFGRGIFVAVTYRDGLLRSEEGVVWERIAAPFSQARKVRWLDDRFMVVGDHGLVASSTDGSHWRVDRDGGDENLVDVARWSRRFAAVAGDGRVLLSDGGANWEPASAPPEASLAAVCGGPWGFVAVGEGVFYSPDGESWVQEVSSEHPWVTVADVLWTGVRYVAIQLDSQLLKSRDGTEWSATPTPVEYPRAIGWNRSELLIVGGHEPLSTSPDGVGTVAISSDGESWTTETVTDHELDGVACGSGQWIAVGAAGTILADPSGQGWVSRSSPVVWDLGGVAVGDGRVVAVGGVMSAHGGSQRSILVSESGVAFVLRDAKPAAPLYDVTWTGSRWVAVGYAGQVATSDDGLTWSLGWVEPQSDDTLFGVAAVGGEVVGVGVGSGNTIVAVSSDGVTWSVHPLGFAGTLLSVAWTGSRFVAVGDSGDVALSDRGGLWTVLPGALPFAARDVVWNGEKLVAVGADGWSAWSVDGNSWKATETGAPESLSSVAWADGRFIAVGGDGYAVSTDGISWQTGTVAPGSALLGVAADAGAAFAVGRNGAIYRLLLGERASGPAPPGRATVVPVTAHTAGLRETSWESDVTVLPTTGGAAEVWLGIRGRGGSTGLWRRFVVPPGGQLVRGDIVAATFGLSHGAEPLWVVSESPVIVTSRTSTVGMWGRLGGGVTPVTPAEDPVDNDRLLLFGLDENGDRRTDIGVTNLTGDTVTAVIDLYRSDGSQIGSRTVDVPPYGVTQINRVIALLAGAQVSGAYAVVSGPLAASFTAYASVIDNRYGDPVFVPPAAVGTDPLVVPAVVHAAGVQLPWTSAVDVVNGGDGPTMFHFELLPAGGGGVRTSAGIDLPPGGAARFPDIMSTLFPGGRVGALRVVPKAGEIAVASRTITGARSTFSQAVPALPESAAFTSGEPAFLPGLGSSPGVRTNIGVVNLGDEPIEIEVALHLADGELLGTVPRELAGHAWAQLDRVYQWVTTGQVANGYAVITTENPNGHFLTYASVIDNSSSDPVTVVGAHAQQ